MDIRPAYRWKTNSGTACAKSPAGKTSPLSTLVGKIDSERKSCNLSSAIRVYVFNYFRALIGRQENSQEITPGHLDADVPLAARSGNGQ